MKQENSDLKKFIEMQSALSHSSDLYAAVEMKAFPRYMAVFIFFLSLALTLDVNTALLYAGVIWLLFRVFQSPLWRWEIHHTNLWNFLFFIRGMFIRWLTALVCMGLFWLRTPQVFQQLWPWPVAIFAIDILLSIFVEGRGYVKAKLVHAALEQEKNRLLEEGRKATEDKNRQYLESKDASTKQALDMLDKLKNAVSKPYQDFQDRSQKRTIKKNELRQNYEAKFGNWEKFENYVKKRLYATMSESDLSQKVAELIQSDPNSLDTLYYLAAEDIHFHVGVSRMPGAEMAEIDAHDQWINHLLQKEYEQIIDKNLSEKSTVTSMVNNANMSSQGSEIIKAIEEIARLRNNAILSDEEFQSKKAELLKRL